MLDVVVATVVMDLNAKTATFYLLHLKLGRWAGGICKVILRWGVHIGLNCMLKNQAKPNYVAMYKE